MTSPLSKLAEAKESIKKALQQLGVPVPKCFTDYGQAILDNLVNKNQLPGSASH